LASQQSSKDLTSDEKTPPLLPPPSEVLLINEPSSHPQSPDHESSSLDFHQELTSSSSSSSLLDDYFLPLEKSIITTRTENNCTTVYTCSKGPDDLPGLKAWTLTSMKSDSNEVKWIVNSRFYEELYLESLSLEENQLGNDKAIRLRLLNQRGKARKVLS
jgi:hypothetical protein